VVDVPRGAEEEVGRADAVGRVVAVVDEVRAAVVEADGAGSNRGIWNIGAARRRSLLLCALLLLCPARHPAPRRWPAKNAHAPLTGHFSHLGFVRLHRSCPCLFKSR